MQMQTHPSAPDTFRGCSQEPGKKPASGTRTDKRAKEVGDYIDGDDCRQAARLVFDQQRDEKREESRSLWISAKQAIKNFFCLKFSRTTEENICRVHKSTGTEPMIPFKESSAPR